MKEYRSKPLFTAVKLSVWVLTAGLSVLFSAAQAEAPKAKCQSIDIPAMRVDEAIRVLAEQTGAKLLFAYDEARTRQSQPVRGCLLLPSALEIMLQGSGLVGVRTEQGAFAIYVREAGSPGTGRLK